VFEIGATLREARVRKRLTLQQVEEDTKIRTKYLQAMEDEDFGQLPGSAYAKGFLHSYAAYLGLDTQIVLDEFNSRHGEQAPDPLAGPSALRRPPRSRRRSGLVFFAVVAVLVLASIYLLGLRGNGADEAPPKVVPSVLSPSASPSVAVASPSPSPSPRPALSNVVIEVTGASCYFEVFEGSLDSQALFADTLVQGQTESFETKKKLFIRVGGDPAALALRVNGKDIRTSGDVSGVVYVVNKGRLTRQ
jgi:hypothetical protein